MLHGAEMYRSAAATRSGKLPRVEFREHRPREYDGTRMHEWLAAEFVPEARQRLRAFDSSSDVRASVGRPPSARSRIEEAETLRRAGYWLFGAGVILLPCVLFMNRRLPTELRFIGSFLVVMGPLVVAVGAFEARRRERAPVTGKVVLVVERERESNWSRGSGIDYRHLVSVEDVEGHRELRELDEPVWETLEPGSFCILHEHLGVTLGIRRLGAMTDALP